ncbi:MAG: hypothetical protein Q4A54_06405 [Parabacteroides sp.]|nr:hypothetical protein [Parabacteroides sp.]
MANPHIPNITQQEESLLYEKLHAYNQGKASYKEVGCYLIVLPRPNYATYSLWFYTPLLEKRSVLFIKDLTTDVITSLRIATTELWYANRSIFITDYNEKRMSTHGDDLIPFGKYRGHYLYEIIRIDPNYINWIACKYTPHTPKEERFTKMAQAYNLIHLDKSKKKKRIEKKVSQFLGKVGDKLKNLTCKIIRVKLEDDPYKTRMDLTTPLFYVRQRLTAIDTQGNLINITIPSHHPSRISGQLPSSEHPYQVGEFLSISSARIAATYESKNIRYTRLTYVKFNK